MAVGGAPAAPTANAPGLGLSLGQETSAIKGVGQFDTSLQVPTNYSPTILGNGGTGQSSSEGKSDLSTLFDKIGSVFSESGHLIESAGDFVARTTVEAVKGTADYIPSLFDLSDDSYNSYKLTQQFNQMSKEQSDVVENLKQGKINLSEFNSEMKSWNTRYQALTNQFDTLSTKGASDEGRVVQNTIDAASTIVTVATAGLTTVGLGAADAGAVDAGQFFASTAARSMFAPAEDVVDALSRSPELFDQLPGYIQDGVKASVTDSLMNVAANATSGSVARSMAVNLALKYPLGFNMLSGTGKQVYKDLETKDYGGAVAQLGFFGGMLLGGGPLGKAAEDVLGGVGSAIKTGVINKVFGEPSWTQIISKAFFDDPEALDKELDSRGDEDGSGKAFQNAAATNINAMKGQVGAAAYRVVNGLFQAGWVKGTFTPEEFVDDMMNWNKANTALHDALTAKGMSAADAARFTVGRWTIGARTNLITALSDPDIKNTDQMLQAWENFKDQFPNDAASNNVGLDKQIKSIIQNNAPEDVPGLIQKIDTQVGVRNIQGVPKKVLDDIAKSGYVPIIPKNMEAPFIQSSAKLVTATSGLSGSFFQKAVQPAPVLGELGGMLTKMGLSPLKAAQTINDVFTDNFAKNLSDSDVLKRLNLKADPDEQPSSVAGYSKAEVKFMKDNGVSTEDIPKKATTVAPTQSQVEPKPISTTTVTKKGKVPIDRSMPRDLKGAKPNYSFGSNRFTLNFKDDLTKALYIVAGKSGSARDADYLAYLKQHFPDKNTTELRSMGAEVRASIKDKARTSTDDSIDVKTHAQVSKLPKTKTGNVTVTTVTKEAANKEATKVATKGAATAETSLTEQPVEDLAKDPVAPKDADFIMRKLQNYMNKVNQTYNKFNLKKVPISDIRQMTTDEIREAMSTSTFKLSETEAKEIQGAAMDAMLQVPVEIKGAGNKVLDYAYGKSSLVGKYMRLQTAGRFTWNPFFKIKLAYKTEILSQLESGGKMANFLGSGKAMNLVFSRAYSDYADIANILEEKGMFSSGFTGEAADTGNAVIRGAPPSQLLKTQKQSIGGLVGAMAERAGYGNNIPGFIDDFPNEVHDTIEMILHYNPNADFLNSPMARTLNMMIFPFRFNVKVGSMIVRTLARTDPLTQMSVLYGGLQAHKFLTSQEGQAWYAQNADVIAMLEYVSPLDTLSAISSLGHIGTGTVGELGELGGLPFGFIGEIFNAEGWTNLTGSPYVSAETGLPATNYIPKSGYAKIATAISSFLGSLFTYPGATAGLPSKSGFLNKISESVTGTTNSDWTPVPETDLTPQQQQFAKIVQQLRGTQETPAEPPKKYQAPGSVSVPPQGSGYVQPLYTRSTTPWVQKANEPVTVLPGLKKKLGE